MSLSTPKQYWRVPALVTDYPGGPPASFEMPSALVQQTKPPRAGDGIALASYDDSQDTGQLLWIGFIDQIEGSVATVDWQVCGASFWVDTGFGRKKWREGSFGFAQNKNTGYGLHALWAEHFPKLEVREELPRSARSKRSNSRPKVDRSRLEPREVFGEPSDGPKAGVVYVLQSAFGFKVGRTSSLPARMREFGVKLPFIYTIPFVAWFDDSYEAERHYHALFNAKRINGEWFDLDEADIDLVRNRIL